MSRLVVLLSFALALWAPTAAADEKAEAHSAFKAGQQAYAQNDFRGAARYFERAADLVSSNAARFNAGLSWEAAGDQPRAASAFEKALESGKLEQTQKVDAHRRLKRLRRALGMVRLRGKGRVSLAHLNNVAAPLDVYVRPGTHSVLVQGEGERTRRLRVEVARGEITDLAIESKAGARAPLPGAPARAPRRPAEQSRGDDGSARYFGYAAYGLSAVAAGGSIVLGLNALSARDQFEASKRKDVDAHDRAARLRTWSNVAVGAAVVFAGVGTYLVFFTPKESNPPRAKARRKTATVAYPRF